MVQTASVASVQKYEELSTTERDPLVTNMLIW